MDARVGKSLESGKSGTFVIGLVTLAMVGGVFYCLEMIQSANLTARESGLLAIVLTIFSIIATWIVSHWYSNSQYQQAIKEVKATHDENLRTYALKAAEKVTNLSNELNRLSVYLEGEIEESDSRSSDIALLSAQARITSAIHIINSLRSVNDTALSDWQGVIGEQLDKQREEVKEREEFLREVVTKIVDALRQGDEHGHAVYQDEIHSTLRSLDVELRTAIKQLGGVSIAGKPVSNPRRNIVTGVCPSCSSAVTYKQRQIPGGSKSLKCKSCNTSLVSLFNGESFSLTLRRVIEEEVQCPCCNGVNKLRLDSAPGSHLMIQCSNCKENVRVFRSNRGVSSKVIDPRIDITSSVPPTKDIEGPDFLDDEIVGRIKAKLPKQPWPRGVHVLVAQDLGLAPSLVSKAIGLLIKRNEAHVQIDGIVYYRADRQSDSDSKDSTSEE